jgi:hypothetical protein
MEQGGMHKHTGFYLAEVGLGIVLVLVTVLFFIWNGSLNDQIATLTQERDELQTEIVIETETTPEIPLYYGNRFTEIVNGSSVGLFPYVYELGIDGQIIGSVEVPAYGQSTGDIMIKYTTNEDVIGLHWEQVELAVEETKDVFIGQGSLSTVTLYDSRLVPVEGEVSVSFESSAYTLSPNVPIIDECLLDEPDNSCHGSLATTTGLLLDGVPIITIEPVEVMYDGHTEGGDFNPPLRIHWEGVSADLATVYFTFQEQSYSIDETGKVEEVDLPDDLVTITDEVYE